MARSSKFSQEVRERAVRMVFEHRGEADLIDAFAWYEERLPGLGVAFLRCVDASWAARAGSR